MTHGHHQHHHRTLPGMDRQLRRLLLSSSSSSGSIGVGRANSPSPASISTSAALYNDNDGTNKLLLSPKPPPPTEELIDRIRRRDWDAVRYRVMSYPADAEYRWNHTSQGVATPLHLAFLHRAPVDVVVRLVEANPQALYVQDSESWTALHVALLYHAAPASILFIIRRGGPLLASMGSRLVGTPLHLACRHYSYHDDSNNNDNNGQDGAPQQRGNTTNHGGGPAAAEDGAPGINSAATSSLLIFRELLMANPDLVKVPNGSGGFPANMLWKSYLKHRRQGARTTTTTTTDGDDDDNPAALHDLMQRFALMLAASKQDMATLRGDNDNHASTIFTKYTLHDIIEFSYQEYANQMDWIGCELRRDARAAQCLVDGKLPLHRVASYPFNVNCSPDGSAPAGAQQDTTSNNDPHSTAIVPARPTMSLLSRAMLQQQQRQQQRGGQGVVSHQEPLGVILSAFPSAAAQRATDTKKNRYPLHIALVDGQRQWRQGVGQLVDAAPHILLCRDPANQNLLPFQLAAAMLVTGNDDNNHGDGGTRVDTNNTIETIETIFHLLCTCPHALDVARECHTTLIQ